MRNLREDDEVEFDEFARRCFGIFEVCNLRLLAGTRVIAGAIHD